MQIIIKRALKLFVLGVVFLVNGIFLFQTNSILYGIGLTFFFIALFTYLMTFLVRIYKRAKPYKGEYAEKLLEFAKSNGLSLKYLLVAKNKHSNAHAMGFLNTTGILFYSTTLEKHPEDEIMGVMAHEIGHIKNHDAFLTAPIIATIYIIVGLLNHWFLIKGDSSLSSIILITTIEAIVILPFVLAINRSREHQADKTAKRILKDPSSLARFLERNMNLLKQEGIIFPKTHSRLLELLSTHPLSYERIKYLNS